MSLTGWIHYKGFLLGPNVNEDIGLLTLTCHELCDLLVTQQLLPLARWNSSSESISQVHLDSSILGGGVGDISCVNSSGPSEMVAVGMVSVLFGDKH